MVNGPKTKYICQRSKGKKCATVSALIFGQMVQYMKAIGSLIKFMARVGRSSKMGLYISAPGTKASRVEKVLCRFRMETAIKEISKMAATTDKALKS